MKVAVADTLPHAGRMLLLDDILVCTPDSLSARLSVRGLPGLPASEDSLPAWVGLEYMAQAVAAWAGQRELTRGRQVRPGLLLGTRLFKSTLARLPLGLSLEVAIHKVLEDSTGVGVFDCEVRAPELVQSAEIKAFMPEDVYAYLKDGQNDG